MKNRSVAKETIKWGGDREFLALPTRDKYNLYERLFDNKYAGDVFRNLSSSKQKTIRDKWIRIQLDTLDEMNQPPPSTVGVGAKRDLLDSSLPVRAWNEVKMLWENRDKIKKFLDSPAPGHEAYKPGMAPGHEAFAHKVPPSPGSTLFPTPSIKYPPGDPPEVLRKKLLDGAARLPKKLRKYDPFQVPFRYIAEEFPSLGFNPNDPLGFARLINNLGKSVQTQIAATGDLIQAIGDPPGPSEAPIPSHIEKARRRKAIADLLLLPGHTLGDDDHSDEIADTIGRVRKGVYKVGKKVSDYGNRHAEALTPPNENIVDRWSPWVLRFLLPYMLKK